ncbi:M16 family metallopeptidase [Abyssalbus ytuae]|uniref:Insulinase family protein n=1 Tax=Abyssalbus ytuae TaxID=2926907 RepID=A0A9E6ZJF2_9FLAO|nr:insulinase family protein [Abyssalbus ytuae]UOB16679.1 insulinase family protein [Abyssalbus ytuae]
MLIRNYLVFIIFLCLRFAVGQEPGEYKPSPHTTGILENGMHYYIVHNENPANRVSFYFAQNVGSVLEEDGQLGLAHFLEHMAFNGTKHFEDKKMIKYLEKNGIKFGTEINAFTDYDETVYSIRRVPAGNEKLLDSILLILHDWSGDLLLTNEEIDNERGVVREELRTRNKPDKRASDKVESQGLLTGSRYAERNPAGKVEIINNFEYQELRDYYKKWYRPDLQAVVIVGDIDEKEVEKKVKKMFSPIPLRDNLPERKVYNIPVNDDFSYVVATDKELGHPTLEYYIKHPVDPSLTEKEELEKNLNNQICNSIFSQRLQAIGNLPGSPVLMANFSITNLVRPLDVLKISAQPKKDSLLPALKFMATELRRFVLYGATPTEFERTRSAIMGQLQHSINEGENRGSDLIALNIYKTFFKNKPLASHQWRQQYKLSYLADFQNKDLIKYMRKYYTPRGNVIGISGSDTITYPPGEKVLKVLKEAGKSTPQPYKEIKYDKKLRLLTLPGSEIVKKEKLKGIDAHKYTLSNGARVTLFPTPYKTGQILFSAISPGGRSLLDQSLLSNSLFATVVASESGLANLGKQELINSGEVSSVKVQLEDYEELLTGNSNMPNAEKLFKGIYLTFTAPGFDNDALEITRQGLERLLTVIKSNVQSDFTDSLKLAKNNYSNREVLLNKELLDKLTIEKAEAVYKDRIRNASDFDFVFVGDMDTGELLSLVKKYIGSIPGDHSHETPFDHKIKPDKRIEKVYMSRPMQNPQATVNLYFTGSLKYSVKNELIVNMIGQLLSKRYLERIREEEGGTYGVKVTATLNFVPEESFGINVRFNCNPAKTERLVQIVYEDMKKLSYQLNNDELLQIKNNLKKEIDERKELNNYWMEKLVRSIRTRTQVLKTKEDVKMIEGITEADIRKMASLINRNAGVVEGVLMPSTKDLKK